MQYQSLQYNSRGKGEYILPGGGNALIKDVDVKMGIVSGYFAAFGNIDAHGDIIDEGSFTKSIEAWGPDGKGRIAHLTDHFPWKRVGVIQELSEDEHGLLYVSKFFDTNRHALARDTLIEIEEGGLKEHSIGFDVKVANRDEETNLWHLEQIWLYEGSHVTWGANAETPIVDVKDLDKLSLSVLHLTDQMKSIQHCLKRGITDETAIELEHRVKQYDAYFKEVLEALSQKSNDDDEPQLVTQIKSIIENL